MDGDIPLAEAELVWDWIELSIRPKIHIATGNSRP